MDVTGQAILRAIVAGERDAATLAKLRDRRIKENQAEVSASLQDHWRDEHLFTLKQALTLIDAYAEQIRECDGELQRLLGEASGVDLTRIPGIDTSTALKVVSEVGTDLGRFANVKHFTSWLGLCPGIQISGGQILSSATKPCANRAALVLRMAAQTLRKSQSALGAYHPRMCARMDRPKVITATAHKLAPLVYFMLTKGKTYVEAGQQ